MIGLARTLEVIGGNVIMPHRLGVGIGVLAALAAAVLPAVAGAAGAATAGCIRTGARIGFWSGVVSGLITFLAAAAVGHLVVHFPELPGVTPQDVGRAYTAAELATYNLGDYLGAGVSHPALIGAPFCGAAGAFGGLLGWYVSKARHN